MLNVHPAFAEATRANLASTRILVSAREQGPSWQQQPSYKASSPCAGNCYLEFARRPRATVAKDAPDRGEAMHLTRTEVLLLKLMLGFRAASNR